MLAREKRRRHHDRHLLAVHGGDEGGAQRHLGLAEAHVAADQAVHGPALLQVLEHGGDGGQLVFGFLVGEPGAEFIEGAIGRRQDLAGLEFARRRGLDEVLGHVADAFLEPGLLGLPGAAAQPVECDALLFRAVAGEQLDILDGQEQPVVAGIHEEQAIVGRALHLDGLEALEAADAVIDMDDEIAGRKRRKFGEEIAGLAVLPRLADQAVAEDILLGDDGEVAGLEALLDAQHDEADDRLGPGFRASAQLSAAASGATSWSRRMVSSRSREPSVQVAIEHALARFAQRLGVGLHRFIDIAALLGALGGEAAAALAAESRCARTVRTFEGRERKAGVVGESSRPFVFGEIEPLAAAAACRVRRRSSACRGLRACAL